ncbi:MAG: type II toxin-antitoxin system RelE/ParE family toxin [Acidobacteriia bacterium]|nr:type II toxin-antitoxin system RelE/ParE family toxin [Terriglobia bacterium]
MYSVKITSRAEGELKRLDRPVRNRVVTAIQALASDPRPPGCLKVRSAEGVWRVRVGDWRIGYEINDSLQEVVVIRVGHRSEFYQ